MNVTAIQTSALLEGICGGVDGDNEVCVGGLVLNIPFNCLMRSMAAWEFGFAMTW